MKKKILLTMFVVCMTLIFFSCYVSATETGTMSGVCGAYGSTDVTWRYDGEGTLTISGSGSMLSYRYDIDTPDWPSDIKYVIIENGVTSIGSYAFRNHTSLESITIADSVTGIGIGAFKGCSSLVNVRLSNGLIAIGPNVFWGCSSLAFIALPDSVQSLGSNDFQQRTEMHQRQSMLHNPVFLFLSDCCTLQIDCLKYLSYGWKALLWQDFCTIRMHHNLYISRCPTLLFLLNCPGKMRQNQYIPHCPVHGKYPFFPPDNIKACSLVC